MAKLVINPTSTTKKEIPIVSRVISIGRDPSNDLVLSDSMVSRRHAILEHRDNQYILRDNNSSNGTMVNGDRVDSEKPLRDGDLVAIGSSRLLFQLDDTAEASLPGSPAAGARADAASPPDPAKVSVPPIPTQEPRCPYCGKPALSSDRFCRGCGRDLGRAPKRIACSNCGTDVQLPADFCGQCGKVLEGNEKESLLSTRPVRPQNRGPAVPDVAAPAPVRVRLKPPGASPATSGSGGEAAGFGIRFLAFLVDEVILGIPLLLGGLVWIAAAVGESPRGGPSGISSWMAIAGAGYSVVCALYYVLFWGARGATPGKSLLGLVVTTEADETPIGFSRALLRLVGYALSSALLGLGFLLILFSHDRRALHDLIAGTRVTRTP